MSNPRTEVNRIGPDKTKKIGPNGGDSPLRRWATELGEVVRGDALEVLRHMHDGSFDLVFADPPFNLRKTYGADVDDDRGRDDYLRWCFNWADQLVRVLAPGGSLFIYNLPRWNVHLAARLDGPLTFRHWIAVDIKYSLPVRGRLYPAHYSLIYLTKGRPRTFAPPRVPIVACPHCGKELKDYGGYKAKLNPRGFNLSDVWSDLSPVRHSKYKAKDRSANQLPLKMLDRVLDIGSVEGDRVLDPFAGSGTTLVAAELKRRRWMGIEIGEIEPIIARMEALEGEQQLLLQLQRTKNRLFTPEMLAARERHGHSTKAFRALGEVEDLDMGNGR